MIWRGHKQNRLSVCFQSHLAFSFKVAVLMSTCSLTRHLNQWHCLPLDCEPPNCKLKWHFLLPHVYFKLTINWLMKCSFWAKTRGMGYCQLFIQQRQNALENQFPYLVPLYFIWFAYFIICMYEDLCHVVHVKYKMIHKKSLKYYYSFLFLLILVPTLVLIPHQYLVQWPFNNIFDIWKDRSNHFRYIVYMQRGTISHL